MKKVVMVVLIFMSSLFAQTSKTTSNESTMQLWQIPFASTGNTISLAVQNNSSVEVKGVTVSFNDFPSWIKSQSSTIMLKSVPPGSAADAEFTFSVGKKAPIGHDTTLVATISTTDGQTWTKEVRVEVGAPTDYKLYNNFPNPFNPSTKIAFELPKASHVSLIIYDVLGREVAEIANQNYPAGYNEVTWNGLNRNGEQVSSGVYFYRISSDKWNKVMKMLMLK